MKNLKESKLVNNGSGFVKEFVSFISKGNVMDLAVGVIIGGAFSTIVTALTEDIIKPLINGIGGAEVAGELKIYGGQVIKYGDFITAIINFIIMAFVLFLIIKSFNKIKNLRAKKEVKEESAPVKSDESVLLEEILKELKKK